MRLLDAPGGMLRFMHQADSSRPCGEPIKCKLQDAQGAISKGDQPIKSVFNNVIGRIYPNTQNSCTAHRDFKVSFHVCNLQKYEGRTIQPRILTAPARKRYLPPRHMI